MKIVAMLIAVLVSFLVVLNAVSSALTKSAPELAVTLNPLNEKARMNWVGGMMVADPPVAPKAISETIVGGVRLSPREPAFYSLLGVLKQQRMNETEQASALFSHALTLNPAEPLALIQRLDNVAKAGDLQTAADIVGVIARRWRQHWDATEAHLPAIMSDPAVFEDFATDIAKAPLGKYLLVESLIKKPETAIFASKALAFWREQGNETIGRNSRRVIEALFKSNQKPAAYLLFRTMLPEAAKASAGYVYNEDFRWDNSGNLFDWIITQQQGFNVSYERRDGAPADAGVPPPRDLVFAFRGASITMSNITQYLLLPPGEYTFQVEYTSQQLRTPNPISVSLRCDASTRKLASVVFQEGTNARQALTQEFSVPFRGCRSQFIFFDVRNSASLIKNRYDGTLSIQRIAVRRKTGA